MLKFEIKGRIIDLFKITTLHQHKKSNRKLKDKCGPLSYPTYWAKCLDLCLIRSPRPKCGSIFDSALACSVASAWSSPCIIFHPT